MRNSKISLCVLSALLGIGCGDDSTMTMDASTSMDAGTPLDADTTVDAGPTPTDAGPADGGDTDGGVVDEGEITMGRLVVADEEGNVSVLDLDEEPPAVLDTFELGTGVQVSADINGRMVYLVQRDADLISILDSGVTFESHVDHYHIHEGAPEMLDHTFTGSQPTHFVRHGGWLAAFYDGSGDVDVLQERTLLAGSPVINTLSTGVAHHGVAVVAHGHVMASLGAEGEALPAEVGIWASTELSGEAETIAGPCPSLHGEASSGNFVLFGCSDGVLAIERHGDHFDTFKIENPAGTIEGTRIGLMIGHDASPVIWGNYGAEGYTLIDAEAGTIEAVLMENAPSSFAFDMIGEHVFVLTVDGMLHRFLADGTSEGSLQVIEAFEPAGHGGGANPTLVAGGARMYVSAPAAQQVVEVHIADFEVERTFAFPAAPASMAVASVSPDFHDDHDHDHDH